MLPYTGLDSRETVGHILVVDSIAAMGWGVAGAVLPGFLAGFLPGGFLQFSYRHRLLPTPTSSNYYSVALRIILRALSPETQPISPTRYYSAN